MNELKNNKWMKGTYNIQNKSKYRGNSEKIIFRSSWEKKFMIYLDTHPQVLWWSSEEISIPYLSPIDNKIHKYFPDFLFAVDGRCDKEKKFMVEIKPYKQTLMPTQKRKTKQFIQESSTFAINQEKWRAAELFCLEYEIKFLLITEKELGL